MKKSVPLCIDCSHHRVDIFGHKCIRVEHTGGEADPVTGEYETAGTKSCDRERARGLRNGHCGHEGKFYAPALAIVMKNALHAHIEAEKREKRWYHHVWEFFGGGDVGY